MSEAQGQDGVKEHVANILLVEDREEDVLFLRRAFRSAELHHRISHVPDGEQAIKYLSRQAPYNDEARYPAPDAVVLDLKMPGTMMRPTAFCSSALSRN